jgi:hypothetical protein
MEERTMASSTGQLRAAKSNFPKRRACHTAIWIVAVAVAIVSVGSVAAQDQVVRPELTRLPPIDSVGVPGDLAFPFIESPYADSEPCPTAPPPSWLGGTIYRGQSGGAFPRTPAEYGPPGYVRRRPQTGPAAPVLVPSAQPLPSYVTEQEANTFVTAGSFPGSYKIPGTNTSFRWGGLVHLDAMYDFDPIVSTDDFVTSTIPVPGEQGQNANFTARWTRLEFETHTDNSRFGDIKTYIQVDFFNGKTQSEFASFPLRLRFAYIDIGNWRFGQDGSVFMDYDVFPNVIDYEGPGGIMLMRQSVARYTLPVTDHFKIAVAAEQPWTDMTLTDAVGTPLVGKRIQNMPDFTSHLRYDTHYGHAQLSGIVRKLTYQPDDFSFDDSTTATGYGINFTGDLHPWALLMGIEPSNISDCESEYRAGLAKSRFLGQYSAGYGLARYIQDANGLGVDAALTSAGSLEALFCRGWFAVYEHWWARRWSSNIVYGENANSHTDTQPLDTYAGSKYLAANLLWVTAPNTYIGIEYLWGERENVDGQSAQARRIQLGFSKNF